MPEEVLKVVEDRAISGFPREICGFLAGKEPFLAQIARPAENIAAHTRSEYSIRPEETLRALLELEARGLKITGIYHSHPNYPSRPSQTDLALADMPEAFYLITSVYQLQAGEFKCQSTVWHLENKRALKAEIQLIN